MSDAAAGPLATVTLRVDAAEIDAFAETLGMPASPVPPTFPIRFLFHPEIRAALAMFLPADGSLPIHVGQRFRYHRPLTAGETLTCAVSATPPGGARPFALVRLDVSDGTGAAVCQAESEIAIAAPGFTWDKLK
ncbi:MAG: MaoC family dehydratase [Alphaproteobacteria bacterium]|nr:MaoC family dehydratase [Alphaproteobacteria bacterium]